MAASACSSTASLVAGSTVCANAGAQASADDLAGARLSVQAQLASDYFALRVTDVLRALYAETTTGYAKALQLTQSQYRAGTVLHSDVALAESTLRAAQAQAEDLNATRAQLEHAIATLTGHVKIERGPNVIEGDKAQINLATNVSQMISTPGQTRVHGIFYPGSDKKPETSPSAPAPAASEPVSP